MKDLFQNKTFKFALIGFLVFVIIVLFLPIVFVKYCMFGLDYRTTGQIGDTIGGITAPFIAIGAAFLTFMAFWVQYQANQKQWSSIMHERLTNNFIVELTFIQNCIKEIVTKADPLKILRPFDSHNLKLEIDTISSFFERSLNSQYNNSFFPKSLFYSSIVFYASALRTILSNTNNHLRLSQKFTKSQENIDALNLLLDITDSNLKKVLEIMTKMKFIESNSCTPTPNAPGKESYSTS